MLRENKMLPLKITVSKLIPTKIHLIARQSKHILCPKISIIKRVNTS